MLYVLLAILLFGILIFIHELGHYIFARIFGVTVNEFSIGMGPKLISVKSKKTGIAYSLRLLPIGGFVSMAGEDEESEDPNSINRKPVWQRIIITAARLAFKYSSRNNSYGGNGIVELSALFHNCRRISRKGSGFV